MELGFSSCSEAVRCSRSRLLAIITPAPQLSKRRSGDGTLTGDRVRVRAKSQISLVSSLAIRPFPGGAAGHATFRPRVEERAAG